MNKITTVLNQNLRFPPRDTWQFCRVSIIPQRMRPLLLSLLTYRTSQIASGIIAAHQLPHLLDPRLRFPQMDRSFRSEIPPDGSCLPTVALSRPPWRLHDLYKLAFTPSHRSSCTFPTSSLLLPPSLLPPSLLPPSLLPPSLLPPSLLPPSLLPPSLLLPLALSSPAVPSSINKDGRHDRGREEGVTERRRKARHTI